MWTQNRWALAVALAVVLAMGNTALAAPPAATTITVEKMCEGCAKKITARLKEVPGVAEVKTEVQAKTVTVTPKAEKNLSPRALWETVEKAGERPIKLEGPSGMFTEKPKS